MKNSLLNNKNLEKFIKNIYKLQQIQKSKTFIAYDKLYKNFFKRFFKLSSVSIIFRLSINRERLFKRISIREGKLFSNEELDKIITDSMKNFTIHFDELIKNSYNESLYNFEGNMEFEIDKLMTIAETIKEIKTSRNEMIIPNKVIYFGNTKINKNIICFDDIIENLEIEVLFIKRANSKRDKYSGNIAFPGGKFEEKDISTFNTSVRETFEEIGINLIYKKSVKDKEKNKSLEILPLYLGPNIGFDVTLDMKNFVTSHIFLIIDLERNLEKSLILGENEISGAFLIPIKFFFDLDKVNEIENSKKIEEKIFTYVEGLISGKKCKIKKIILNNDPNFMLYGMTLRKIIGVLNSDSKSIKYEDEVIFESEWLNFYYKMIIFLIKFFNNSKNSFMVFKKIFYLLSIYLFGKIIFKEVKYLNKYNAKF